MLVIEYIQVEEGPSKAVVIPRANIGRIGKVNLVFVNLHNISLVVISKGI